MPRIGSCIELQTCALHGFGGVRQNSVEFVELLEAETERKDHLLLAEVDETARTGVYGSERLLEERKPRTDILST